MFRGKAKLLRSLVIESVVVGAKEMSAEAANYYIESGDLGDGKETVEPYDRTAVEALFTRGV